MDERHFEHAEELTRLERESSIARARAAARRVLPPDFDGLCTECEDTVPPERLALGASTCMMCQTRLELRRKLHL
jgi:RNA polymerase-binding transcription factor DksA